MHWKLWPALLISALFSMAGVAQSYHLELQIADKETNDPLPLASVKILGVNRAEAADLNGVFRKLVPAGFYEVTVDYVGYKAESLLVRLNRDTLIKVGLESEATGLQTVEVVGNNSAAAMSQPIMGIERLTTQQLMVVPAVLGEADVLKGLQMLPGVGSAGEASNGISVRGGSLDQNLVLLDNAPIFNPTHLFGLFSIFPPDGLAGADLYKGNVPARFGGRAASVLDVRMRNPSSNRTTLAGSVGLVSSRISMETPVVKDKLHALVALRGGFNDFWFKVVERLKNTRANFGDALLKLRWRAGERHSLSFTGFYSRDMYQIDLINNFNGVVSDKNIYEYNTLNGTLESQYSLSDKTFLQTTLVSADFNPGIRFPEVQSSNEVVYRSRLHYLSLGSRLFHQASNDALISGGIQLNRYDNRPGELDPGQSTVVNPVTLPKEIAFELAAYGDGEWSLGEDFSFSAGLRYALYLQTGPLAVRSYSSDLPDDDEVVDETVYPAGKVIKTYNGLEPRLGLRWSPGRKVSLKAGYTVMRQYLQNIYNTSTPLPTSRWKTAGEYIKPQYSRQFSAGVFLSPGAQYQISLETYYRLTDNILEYKPGADFFLKKYVETDLLQGKGKAYGIEFSLQKTGGKNTGWINYTYARGFNQVTGADFASRINDGKLYPNNFDRPHTLNVIYTLADQAHHSLSLNFTLSSGRPYTIPNGYVEINNVIVPLFLERNNSRIPAYHRLDLSWRIHNPSLKKKRWTADWVFTVYNIYGRKNAYNIYYAQRTGGLGYIFGNSSLGSYRLSIFGAPIASLAYQFKFQ
ncbi:MAG: TonB-dependent receptor [Lewinellaceae bacterium]|nr:TonB-dependent receptor [Lewinella sp.]MCB9281351.1 TonB-dependent receptor [Lewinellaceae bacterium]